MYPASGGVPMYPPGRPSAPTQMVQRAAYQPGFQGTGTRGMSINLTGMSMNFGPQRSYARPQITYKQCPMCNGECGFGPFGPCKVNTVHYKGVCPCCKGNGSIESHKQMCRQCEGKGGVGAFGPCKPYSVHFQSNCARCGGAGYGCEEMLRAKQMTY